VNAKKFYISLNCYIYQSTLLEYYFNLIIGKLKFGTYELLSG